MVDQILQIVGLVVGVGCFACVPALFVSGFAEPDPGEDEPECPTESN